MGIYRLKLFIDKNSLKSARLLNYFNKIARDLDNCELEVIDVLEQPELAEQERIIATPTLIRYEPLPVKRIIGDLNPVEEALNQIRVD